MKNRNYNEFASIKKRIYSFVINFLTTFPIALMVYYIYPSNIIKFFHELFGLNFLFWIIYFLGTSIQIIFEGTTLGDKIAKIITIDIHEKKNNKYKKFINNLIFCIIWGLSLSNLEAFIILIPVYYLPLFLQKIIGMKQTLIEKLTKSFTINYD